MTIQVPAVPTPPPQSTDLLNFDARADAYHTAMPGVIDGMNAQNVENNAINANVNAQAAAAQAASLQAQAAAQASLQAGVPVWVSGTNYTLGFAVSDPVDLQVYRRRSAGSSATRPGLDAATWAMATLGVSAVNAVVALDIDCTAGNYFTKTISASSTFTFSSVPQGRAYGFTLEVNHTGGAITWPAAVRWPYSTPPALTAGCTHLFMFVTDDGGARWRGAVLPDYTT
jgi:hypothetical protein